MNTNPKTTNKNLNNNEINNNNKVNQNLKKHSAFIIFKPHFVFFSHIYNTKPSRFDYYGADTSLHSLSISLAFDSLKSFCESFNFSIINIINTSFKNEEQLRKFYPHIADKPFFKYIKRDCLENSRIDDNGKIINFDNEKDELNIEYKKNNLFIAFLLQDNSKIPRNEKKFYSDIRKIVDFTSVEKDLNMNSQLEVGDFNSDINFFYRKESLRDQYALDRKTYNSIHATDSEESFLREKEVILSTLTKNQRNRIISLNKQKEYDIHISKHGYQNVLFSGKGEKYNDNDVCLCSHPFKGVRQIYSYRIKIYEKVKEKKRNFFFGIFFKNQTPKIIYYRSFTYLSYIINYKNLIKQKKEQNLDWATLKYDSLEE